MLVDYARSGTRLSLFERVSTIRLVWRTAPPVSSASSSALPLRERLLDRTHRNGRRNARAP
jgi:hypothetical protein